MRRTTLQKSIFMGLTPNHPYRLYQGFRADFKLKRGSGVVVKYSFKVLEAHFAQFLNAFVEHPVITAC